MAKSKFVISFATSVVTRGSKVSGFANPTLYTSPVKDKFVIDSKGFTLLELAESQRINMLDHGSIENLEAMMGNIKLKNPSRFGLYKGYTNKNGVERGSKIGATNVFNYTKVWGNMIHGEDGTSEISMRELYDLGLVRKGETDSGKTTWGATQKIFYRIEPLMTEEGEHVIAQVEEGVELPMFSLIEFDRSDVKEGESTEEVNDEQPEEDYDAQPEKDNQ